MERLYLFKLSSCRRKTKSNGCSSCSKKVNFNFSNIKYHKKRRFFLFLHRQNANCGTNDCNDDKSECSTGSTKLKTNKLASDLIEQRKIFNSNLRKLREQINLNSALKKGNF
jgi:hypothetical protein